MKQQQAPNHGSEGAGAVAPGVAREARLNFRLAAEHKALIERAAYYSGETVTAFAISTLVNHARHVIQDHEMTILSDRDRDLFLSLLDTDLPPNEALQQAAQRHKQHVVQNVKPSAPTTD